MKNIVEIDKLREQFSGKCSRFIVTGSNALSVIGLVDESEVNDIDIIVENPKESLIESLRILEGISPVKGRPEYHIRNPLDHVVRFEVNGIKVDVFIKDSNVEVFEMHGFYFATPKHIFDAKIRQGRLKDKMDLFRICKKIMDRI